MSIFNPKLRSIICICICIIAAIIIYFFTDLGIVLITNVLIFLVGFIISYLISTKIDIRISNFLFYIIVLISLKIVYLFNDSDLALNLNIKNLEKNVKDIVLKECQNKCSINNRTIYNDKKVGIYKWHGMYYVYSGYIISDNNDIEYEISLDDKCITKKLNNSYNITNGRCK